MATNHNDSAPEELTEKVIYINRVATEVKG